MSAGQKRHPTPQAQSHVTDGAQRGFSRMRREKAATGDHNATVLRHLARTGRRCHAGAVVAVRQRHAGAPRRRCDHPPLHRPAAERSLEKRATAGVSYHRSRHLHLTHLPNSPPLSSIHDENSVSISSCIPDSSRRSRAVASRKRPRRAIASSLVRASDPAGSMASERRRCSISWSRSKCIEGNPGEHMFACRDRNDCIGCATMTP